MKQARKQDGQFAEVHWRRSYMIQDLQAKDTEVHGRLEKNRWSEHVEENTKEEERWTLAKNMGWD